MPIWTLVSGVRSSCDAAAMNSDFSRLISLRCVMSSSSVTAPDQAIVGVAHRCRSNAERPAGAVDGPRQQFFGAFRRHGLLGAQHVGHGLDDAPFACDVVDRPADHLGARAEQALGGGVHARHTSLAVGDDDRIVERVDGGFRGLLRDEQLTEIGSPQFADALGHPVEPGGQRADLVVRLHGDGRVEVAARLLSSSRR